MSAPDGNTKTQFEKLLQKATLWVEQMRTGVIKKNETWLALQSTIWRTLCYPLNAVNLTKQQCEAIMSPILQYALPAMGICRNFPRALVFSSTKYTGIGIKHIHTLQEIARLKDILHHTYTGTITGQFYRTSLEYLLLELGMSTDISAIDYNNYHSLATNGLVKSTWEFLCQHNITLRHDIDIPKNTLHDYPIMSEIRHLDVSKKELEAINQCRLYLKAYHVSDLATASGSRLSYHAWEGTPREHGQTNRFGWPEQGKPSKSSWETWRKFLRMTLLARGTKLKKDLGHWVRKDHDIWQWYYCPNLDNLIQITKNNVTYLYGRYTRNRSHNVFHSEGKQIEQLPPALLKASVKQTRNGAWWLTDRRYNVAI